MRSTTNILYILGFLISVFIWSTFGLFSLNLLQENYFLTISQEVKNDIINLLKDYGAK